MLDELVNHFNLSCCNLYLLNPVSQGIQFQEWSGKRPSDIQLNDYMMNYFHTDSTHELMLSGPCGHWLTPNLRGDKEVLESTDAYQKWAIPNNFIYSTGTPLLKEEHAVCAIHFNRGKEHPAFTQDEEDRFRSITPYLQKAIELRIRIARSERSHSLLRSAINSFRLPVAVLNEFAEVVATNNLMNDYLSSQSLIGIKDKTLSSDNKEDDFHLRFSIANTISSVKNKPLEYTPQDITLKNAGVNHKVGVSELSEYNDDRTEVFVGAMVYLISETHCQSVQPEQLQQLFSMTPSEAIACCHLMNNRPIKAIADIESKSPHTVREQIQNCYKKTGVKNQLELINLLGSLLVVQ